MRGKTVNTCIVGHRGLRDGAIHTGAVALMLGAALAMNTARAQSDVDRDDTSTRPAPEASSAPSASAAPSASNAPSAPAAPSASGAPPAAPASRATSPAPAAPEAAGSAHERTDSDAAMRAAEERMRDAQRRMHDARERMNRVAAERSHVAERSADEREDIDERMREAQERISRAAAEIAAIATERASEAMANMKYMDGIGPSRGLVIGVDLDPQSTGGARVRDVSPGGPAEEAGLRADDVIVMLNGKDVKGDAPGESSRKVVRELQAFRGKYRGDPDAKLKVQVLRDGKPKDFEVTPRRIVSAFAFSPRPRREDSDGAQGQSGPFNFNYNYNFFGNSDLAGLEVTTLTPQLGRYFGTSKGVLVVRAPKLDTYKLQDGDVIVAIDGREPTSGSHITRILSSYQPGEKVTLRVMRDHKAQQIQVTVPDHRQSRAFSTWVSVPM
jgi:C-terminal processing protease CtpA/Prc